MNPEEIKSDKVLDTRGLSSPMPVLKMINALRSLAKGKTLEVWCSDPDFQKDFNALCDKKLNRYLGQLDDPDGYIRFFIKKENKQELQ